MYPQPKSALALACRDLADILDAIDQGADVPVPAFDARIQFFQDACERRIQGLALLGAEEQRLRRVSQEVLGKAKALEHAAGLLKQDTMAAMQQNPELSFQGHTGTLKIHKNGGVSPITWRTITVPTSISRTLPFDPATESLYPAEYLTKRTVYVLDPAFEDDLRKGKTRCCAATVLERGQHLKVT